MRIEDGLYVGALLFHPAANAHILTGGWIASWRASLGPAGRFAEWRTPTINDD